MSDHLAIATVSAVLHRMAAAAIRADFPAAAVTLASPDDGTAAMPSPGVGICLYQAVPNAQHRNALRPDRRAALPTAFDLHYLFSFYGDAARLEPQRMLGNVAQALHREPVISPQAIRAALADPLFDYLAPADLAETIEPPRILPLALSLEQLAALRSLFPAAPFRLSLAYQVSSVQIGG